MSIYPLVEKILIVNAGYSLTNPKRNENTIPVQQVSKDISNLDVEGKIIEITNFSNDDLQKKIPLKTQMEVEIEKSDSIPWYDLRGRNLTFGNEIAIRKGATYIIKLDTDQAVYKNTINILAEKQLLPWQFAQWEFAGEVGKDAPNTLTSKDTNHSFNDVPFMYPPINNQVYYHGGGGPMLGGVERIKTKYFHSAHLREAVPIDSTMEEREDNFYGRYLYHSFVGSSTGDFTQEMIYNAKSAGKELAKRTKNITEFPSKLPPEITLLPRNRILEYLEMCKKRR